MHSKSIEQTFRELRARGRIGLMPFLPAGYPSLATTCALLPALEAGGASVIEIGFPFSDPVADGPTVQQAFTAALAKKIKVAEIFAAIGAASPSVSLPLVAMVSYSIVFRHGLERLRGRRRRRGICRTDHSRPASSRGAARLRHHSRSELDTILLIAPTTAPERRREIARLSSGFVYYLSVSGITGERNDLPSDLIGNLAQLREITDRPLCVGFGISRPEHVAKLSAVADGAIVGSALVKQMQSCHDQGPQVLADRVKQYCLELLSQVRPG